MKRCINGVNFSDFMIAYLSLKSKNVAVKFYVHISPVSHARSHIM